MDRERECSRSTDGSGPRSEPYTIALAALKDVRAERDVPALLVRWADLLLAANQTPAGRRAVSTVLRYIWIVHPGLDLQKVGERLDTILHGSGAPLMATAHQLIQEGLERGLEQGLEQGLAKGRDEGVLLGRRSTLRHLFQLKFGPVTEEVLARIESADAATLDRWEERILTAATMADTLR